MSLSASIEVQNGRVTFWLQPDNLGSKVVPQGLRPWGRTSKAHPAAEAQTGWDAASKARESFAPDAVLKPTKKGLSVPVASAMSLAEPVRLHVAVRFVQKGITKPKI